MSASPSLPILNNPPVLTDSDALRVARDGHVVLHHAADPFRGTPDMSFTIGMCQRAAPDLLVIGLEGERARQLLGDLVSQAYLRDRPLEGNETMETSDGTPCRISPVLSFQAQHFAGAAYRFGHSIGRPVAVLQVLLADARGRFPGNPLCNTRTRLEQDLALHFLSHQNLPIQ